MLLDKNQHFKKKPILILKQKYRRNIARKILLSHRWYKKRINNNNNNNNRDNNQQIGTTKLDFESRDMQSDSVHEVRETVRTVLASVEDRNERVYDNVK